MLKIIQILLILLFSFSTHVFSKEIIFTWTPNTDDCTEGYKIVMDSGTNVILVADGKEINTITYTIEEDRVSHTFSIFAYGTVEGEMEQSDLGDMLSWCYVPDRPTIINIREL